MHDRSDSWSCFPSSGNMHSDLCTIRSHFFVILSKEKLSLLQSKSRLDRRLDLGPKHLTAAGSVASKARSERPKVTTLSEDRYIKLGSPRDGAATSSQMQDLLNKEHKTPISKSPLRRGLSCCSGLRGQAAVSKPLVRKENKAKH